MLGIIIFYSYLYNVGQGDQLSSTQNTTIMATRSNIAIYNSESQIAEYIYVHVDGYYEGVGAILKEHYQDVQKVKRLIAGGDISSLGKEVEIPEGVEHSFESPAEDVTVFYSRDRQESDVEAQKVYLLSLDKLHRLKKEEYLYVYLELEKKWLCTHSKNLVEL